MVCGVISKPKSPSSAMLTLPKGFVALGSVFGLMLQPTSWWRSCITGIRPLGQTVAPPGCDPTSPQPARCHVSAPYAPATFPPGPGCGPLRRQWRPAAAPAGAGGLRGSGSGAQGSGGVGTVYHAHNHNYFVTFIKIM